MTTAKELAAAGEMLTSVHIAIVRLLEILNDDFMCVVDAIDACTGRVVLVGLGKSGHIARKISASLSSVGVPSHFVHAAEALHGDLGAISSDDVVILVSHSGQTREVCEVASRASERGVRAFAIAGVADCDLAYHTEVVLVVHAEDPHGVPSVSTTATLIVGDMLIAALMARRNVDHDAFVANHPGGAIGRHDEMPGPFTDLPL